MTLTPAEARGLVRLGWIAREVRADVVRKARDRAYASLTFEEVCRLMVEELKR